MQLFSQLRNLGDIDRQTIAGALSTGTHGTGAGLGGLATFIRGMELVTADGDVLWCSPHEEPEIFHCARIGLGALGVVTKVELACVPAFTLRHTERAAKLSEIVDELDELADGHDHFELYWLPHTDTVSLLCNDRTDDAPRPKSAYKRWRAEVFYPNYFFGALVAVILWPLIRAWARRIEQSGVAAETEAELEALRERVGVLEEMQPRMVDLEDRMEFAERVLVRGQESAEPDRLPGR